MYINTAWFCQGKTHYCKPLLLSQVPEIYFKRISMLPSPAEKNGAGKVYRMKSNFWLVCIPQKYQMFCYYWTSVKAQFSKVHGQVTHSSTLEACNTCLQRRKVRCSMVSLTKKEGGELMAQYHHLSWGVFWFRKHKLHLEYDTLFWAAPSSAEQTSCSSLISYNMVWFPNFKP